MKKPLIFAFIFQILILISMLFFAYAPLKLGEMIKVQATGYDPRDLLLGNYSNLRYEHISSIFTKEYFKNKEQIYLSLQKQGSFYIGKTLSREKPNSGLFLKGRVDYSYQKDDGYKTHLIFGIEKYYSTAKNSKNLEKKLRKQKAIVTLGVLNGLVRIKSVEI